MLRQVKGTKDIIDNDYHKMQHIWDTAYKVSDNYGFKKIATPIFEHTEVFTKTLGSDSDIITKEMYTFTDKGENSITLRPEFTAAIARSFITNSLVQMPSPLKLICHGPLFRYERPQQGRLRQFHQVNCEVIGDSEHSADIEIISLAVNFLKALGIENKITLELNSLGDQQSYQDYRQALIAYFSSYQNDLSAESQKKLITNPLRILDSKDQTDQDLIKNAPKIADYYNSPSADFFSKVKEGLDAIGIHYVINPYLVRGLDYYCHTTFEFTTTELGAQSAVIAGGRYDTLIKNMGGQDTPAIGFAGGIERLSALTELEEQIHTELISIISIDVGAITLAMKLAHVLRRNNITINLMLKGNLKKRMKKAETSKAVIFIGAQEMQCSMVTIKNMNTGQQEQVNYDNILNKIQVILQ